MSLAPFMGKSGERTPNLCANFLLAPAIPLSLLSRARLQNSNTINGLCDSAHASVPYSAVFSLDRGISIA